MKSDNNSHRVTKRPTGPQRSPQIHYLTMYKLEQTHDHTSYVCMCIISILDSVHEFKEASKFNTFKNVVSDYIYVRMNLYHENLILSFFYTLQFTGHKGNEKTLYKIMVRQKKGGGPRLLIEKF